MEDKAKKILTHTTIRAYLIRTTTTTIKLIVSILSFGIWLFIYHHTLDQNQTIQYITFAIIFSFSINSLSSFRYMAIDAYSYLYKHVISYWIKDYSVAQEDIFWQHNGDNRNNIAKLFQKDIQESDNIFEKALSWLHAKIYTLPPVLAKVIFFFLKKTPLQFDTSWVKEDTSKDDLRHKIEEKRSDFMHNLVQKALSFYISTLNSFKCGSMYYTIRLGVV